MNFRPTDSAISPAGDAPVSGAVENTGLSSADFSGTELSRAQQFFQGTGDGGGLAARALSGLDISGISAASNPIVGAGAGAEAAALMPPAGTGAEAGVLAGLAGANEPISPVIQLILKLPGAMGLVNSFFEFLANFFFSPQTFLELFNPMTIAQHAAATFTAIPTQMSSLTFSMLPANAPILSSMSNLAQPMMSSDLLSAKLNMSLGNSAGSYSTLAGGGGDAAFHNNSLNVGGELGPHGAVFEQGAGNAAVGEMPQGHLSGPSLTNVGTANHHVAGNTRLFSDRMTSGGSFNSMNLNLAAKTPSPYGTTPTGVTPATGISQGMNPVASSSLGSSALQQHPGHFLNNAKFEGGPLNQIKESFAPNTSHDVGYDMTPGAGQDVGYGMSALPAMDASGASYGPSGYVGNELGAAGGGNSNNMLAMDQPLQSFKPTLSGAEGQFRSSFPSGTPSSGMSAGGAGQAPVAGLKAKQLSLDSIAGDAPKQAVSPSTAHGASPTSKIGNASGKAADVTAHKPAADAPSVQKAHSSGGAHHKAVESVKAHKPAHHEVSHKAPARQAVRPETVVRQPRMENGTVSDSTVNDGTAIAVNDAAAPAEYTIQKGDNLWDIAKSHLGSGTKWQEIYDLNQTTLGQNPDLIYPGTTIQLPGASSEIASTGTTTMTNYVVKPGDNLWDISHDTLGKGSQWGEIYRANQHIIGDNPRLIHPGQELSIPSSDPAGATVANSPVDPSAVSADPNAMGASPDGQSMAGEMANPQDHLRSSVDSVKSMQGAGTEYGGAPDQYVMPQQAAPQVQAHPQHVSSYPEPDYVSMDSTQSSFQPTTISQAGKGLKVLPANSQPIEAGPGSAMAAAPMPVDASAAASAANARSAAAAGGYFSQLKSLFAKTK